MLKQSMMAFYFYLHILLSITLSTHFPERNSSLHPVSIWWGLPTIYSLYLMFVIVSFSFTDASADPFVAII
jgi:hypothetical protein